MDNDTLDSMDQFKGTVVAVVNGLRRLAPAAIQDGIGGSDPRRRRRFGIAHHGDQDIERALGTASRQRADFGKRFKSGSAGSA